ncbi:hypothetical protein acdb102_34140 [Acidothermaceae bacterium B102]|nr:hypothetical protein acdb102_34140 [Acidothermaceae bacterium B102]
MTEPTEPAQPGESTDKPEPATPRRGPLDRRRGPGDGLASLVGSGSSQVGTNGALRARDVSRPR